MTTRRRIPCYREKKRRKWAREKKERKKYAKADAFLSKLKHANKGGKKEDQEDDEDLEIDSSKNTDTFFARVQRHAKTDEGDEEIRERRRR